MFQKFASLLAAIVLTVSSFTVAQGHFLYVYGEDGRVKVVFGEGLEPDQAKFLDGLASMKAHTITDGAPAEVAFDKKTDEDLGWFEAALEGLGPEVNVWCPYGVFNRGELAMFLDYSGKYVRYSGDAVATKPAKDLSLDLIPSFKDGQLNVAVYFKGMPLADAEVSLIEVSGNSFDTTSNDTGNATLAASVRYLVRAKHVVAEAGEVDGKKFSEKRYYCTMVLDLGSEAAEAMSAAADEVDSKISSDVRLERVDAQFEDMPRGMTSFGAAALGNKLYVAGGKSGRAHSYARAYQNNEIYCLDLSTKKWEIAGDTLGLQGLAIVGIDGKIIRIGGMEARNEEGEEHELRSLADVKAFDPETKKWTKFPSLPQGRSSLDACVYDNKVYVVGGWTMAIGEDSQWATEMLVLDVAAEEPMWRPVETPFQNRALAVRALDGKLFVIGGINEDGTTDEVHVFDIKSQKWSGGPSVPAGGDMAAFGCSAVTLGGRLLVSTYDGGIYQLSAELDRWEKIHQLEAGRFFHQMLPIDESSFALVGGAHMRHGSFKNIEVYQFAK